MQYAAADDDALPAIEGLQITGEAFPGRQLQACGYSINGTTSCNFEVHLLVAFTSCQFISLIVAFVKFFGFNVNCFC